MSGARINIDPSRLERLLTRAGGLGERMLVNRAQRVAELARVYSAGHGTIPAGIIVGPYEYKSISVISTNPHTLFVHNGTRPHQIRPRRAGGRLRFQVGGRTVYARVVNHPGYGGDPFLTRALRDGG